MKWQFQPERRGASWLNTIREQRTSALLILQDNPSFRKGLELVVAKAYAQAAETAANVIKRKRTDLPPECPYTVEQLLDEGYFPS